MPIRGSHTQRLQVLRFCRNCAQSAPNRSPRRSLAIDLRWRELSLWNHRNCAVEQDGTDRLSAG